MRDIRHKQSLTLKANSLHLSQLHLLMLLFLWELTELCALVFLYMKKSVKISN